MAVMLPMAHDNSRVLSGKGKHQFSKQVIAGGKAEYYAAKKIRNGEKTLIATNTGKGKEMAKSMESRGNKRTNAMISEAGRQKKNDGAPQPGTVQVQMGTGIDKTNKYNQGSNMDRIKEQGVKAIDAAKQFITATAIDFIVSQKST
eukprot:6128474-Ditylum_brightwellii.AAC.1